MRADEYFATEWPEEVPRLRRMLARNGIRPDDVDDVLQESAARLYAAWGRVFEDRPLRPLVTTIALNAARDHHRRAAHRPEPVCDLPEDLIVEPAAPEHTAIARLEVSRAARALATMPVSQRRVVLEAVSDELAGEQHGRVRAPAARRMAISRARRQLVTAMELIAAAVGIAAVWVRRTGSRSAVPVTAAAAGGALMLSAWTVWQPDRVASTRSTQVASTSAAAHPQSPVRATAPRSSSTRPVVVVGHSSLYSGTQRWWSPVTGSLVSITALGNHADIRDGSSAASCGLRLAGSVVITFRCPSSD